MKLISVGDLMPGGIMSITGTGNVSPIVRSILDSGDVRVGNFECAVEVNNPSSKKIDGGGNTIFCKSKDVERIKDLGINIVSLANNHSFDLGPEGAYKAMDILKSMGILYCGVGKNLAEAQTPAVVNIGGETFAFLAFADVSLNYMYEATTTEPGVNPLREDYCLEQIRRNVETYNHVVVIPHWGKEYTNFPTTEVVRLSRLMLKAGASLILGGHSHRIQPIVNYRKDKCVVFSMGNFYFSDRIINTPRFTWYPDSEIDLLSLPRVVRSCPVVSTPTIKEWPKYSYIGMIVQCSFSDLRLSVKYYLTQNDKHNTIGLLKNEESSNRFYLALLGLSIRLHIYWFVYFGYSCFSKFKSVILK